MATISDPFLFRWDSVDQLGDLERLQLVLDALPDEPLMQLLEADRGHGRNDYPVRPMPTTNSRMGWRPATCPVNGSRSTRPG